MRKKTRAGFKANNRTFHYISPIENALDERAKVTAELVEATCLDIVDLVLDIIGVRTKQIYEEIHKKMKEVRDESK